MTPTDLVTLLDRLITGWENEVVEFKEGGSGFSTAEIGKYFSALSNEANLRDADAGWLVFGVSDKKRQVVGTGFRPEPERLHALKQQIADSAEPPATFRAIHELDHPDGRVLLFEIPPAPRGIPISWNGHYYARNGESLGPLSLVKQDEIRGQGARTDWSAVVVPGARLDHLDPEALAVARDAFAARHSARLKVEEIAAWSLATFLERASLTIDGGITRAALLLLGKRESFHLLSPLLAEITWRLVSEERAYEHFGSRSWSTRPRRTNGSATSRSASYSREPLSKPRSPDTTRPRFSRRSTTPSHMRTTDPAAGSSSPSITIGSCWRTRADSWTEHRRITSSATVRHGRTATPSWSTR